MPDHPDEPGASRPPSPFGRSSAPAAAPAPLPPTAPAPAARPDEPIAALSGAEGRAGRGRTAVVAVLALLLAAAVGVAGVEWRRADDADSTGSTRTAVAEAAGRFTEALLGYDYNDLGGAKAKVAAVATDAFVQQYDSGFATLASQITSLHVVATATVSRVYVSDVEGDAAKAVVVADSEVRSSSTTQRRLGQYLDLALVRQGGKWRVDTVTYLGRLDEQTSGPQSPQAPATSSASSSGSG